MRAVTLRDVALKAGTSVATVSAVLNGSGKDNIRVGSRTRTLILNAAEELGYSVNSLARSLVTGRTGVIGLVFPYAGGFLGQDPYCSLCLSGIMEEAVTLKYNLMLHTAIGSDWSTLDHAAVMDSRVDGLILVLPEPNSSLMERCQKAGFPCVTVGLKPRIPSIYAVNADDFAGGKIATQHLIALGHRRIAHLAGYEPVDATDDRRRGYIAALEEAGIPVDPALILPTGFAEEEGYTAIEKILAMPQSERPTAVFTANDLCADGALQALHKHGIRVPEEISLVGYDDSVISSQLSPPLTTIQAPIMEMGRVATRLLVRAAERLPIEDPQPVLPVRLIERDSSGPHLVYISR